MGSIKHLLIVVLHLNLLVTLLALNDCGFGFERKKKQCIDVDECVQIPGICSDNAQCINTNGSYYCQCDHGFESTSGTSNFTAIDGVCIDVNECIDFKDICGSHTVCENSIGSYRCSCLEGFARHSPHSPACKDINECQVDAFICGQLATCENNEGSYRCRCHTGASNFGRDQARCVELKCELYKTEGKSQKLLPGLESFLALMRNSCMELDQSSGGAIGKLSGETLLEKVLTAGDGVLSGEPLENSGQVSQLLSSMENAIRLIGPQLKEPRTRKETKHAEVELLLTRQMSPPRGPIHLSTEHVQMDTTWETAAGTSAYPGFAVASLVAYKDLESSTNSSFHEMEKTHSDMSFQINSKVVTVYVSNPVTSHLSTPVNFTFFHLQSKETEHTCVYWNSSSKGGSWSPRGCVKTESNSTHTACSCSHLSSFAVLMALYDIEDAFQLQVITQVGLSLSLVCLFLCIVTFSCCRSIQGTRNTIHLHLCVSLFFADLIFLAGISSTENRGGCAFVAGLLHFFFLSAFCWMCLEGVQLYRMVVLVFNTTLHMVQMLAAGYGAPLLIVVISAMANTEGYGTKRYCWLSLEKGFIWSFFGPVCAIIIVNIFFFTITVWKLAKKFSSLNPELSKLRKIRTFTITAIAQLCVLGIMWIFGCFQFEKNMLAMSYLFSILNSLQGVFIFVMHCLLSKQVREEYVRFLSCTQAQEKRKEKYSETSSSQALRMTQSTGESHI
ncbi:adhesion G protein-coupled receptor E1-like [Arapaima gigas]